MTGITVATHRATPMTAFSRRMQAALAAGALLVMALLVALLLAVQSGHSTQATTVPAQELGQQDPVPAQPTQFIFRNGEPY